VTTRTVPSPNSDHKRGQIVAAARTVLARDGLAGCTARAVAEASPLTKSAINYYFGSLDEIIDLAMAGHVTAMLDGLRAVSGQHADPYRRLHAVIQGYLDTFADQPHAAFLWFEYWIAVGRRGSTEPAGAMLGAVRDLLAELVTDLPNGLRATSAQPAGDPDQIAGALLSWLLGSVVQQQVHPLDPATVTAEADRVLGLSPARPGR
jgi:AcrR family transcriptional regulator